MSHTATTPLTMDELLVQTAHWPPARGIRATQAIREASDQHQKQLEDTYATFRTQVEAMNAEARASVRAAGSNRRRAATGVDAVLARYTPGFETFAVMLEANFAARAAAAPTEEARVTIAQTGATTVARVRGVADQVRAGLAQQAPDGRAPEQPRNTQPSTGY